MKKIIKFFMNVVLYKAEKEYLNTKLSFTDKLLVTNSVKQILKTLKIK